MKLDYLNNSRKEAVSLVLFWLSAALAVLILVKTTDFFVETAKAQKLARLAISQNQTDANDTEKYFVKSKEIVEALKKKNLFVPPEPKKHPVKQVSGILGNEALIDGKWYRVGDKISDAEVMKIEATKVTIKWDGKEKVFAPISAATVQSTKQEKPVDEKKAEPDKAEVVQQPVKVAEAPVEEDPLAWMGVKLSAKARAALLKYWNNASDEEKEKAKEEWNNMSDEEKQDAVDSLEQHADEM